MMTDDDRMHVTDLKRGWPSRDLWSSEGSERSDRSTAWADCDRAYQRRLRGPLRI